MGKMERPDFVRKAIIEGDRETLSALGKKGAEVSLSHRQQREDLRKALKAEEAVRVARERAELETISPDGDVLPPDPKVIESFKKQQ